MTGLEENGDGSAFIIGYASRELRGELSDEGTSSRADRGAGGWTVITILQTNNIISSPILYKSHNKIENCLSLDYHVLGQGRQALSPACSSYQNNQ